VQKPLENYAFVDCQNVYRELQRVGFVIDWKKFQTFLRDKYAVKEAFIFVGFIEENKSFYDFLERIGYRLIFKPTVSFGTKEVKGNCDAELVLHAMIEFPNYRRAVIVSGDGDFACLVEYLQQKDKLQKLLVPNYANFSSLFRKVIPIEKIATLHDKKSKIGMTKEETDLPAN